MKIVLQSVVVVIISLCSFIGYCQPDISFGATERLDWKLKTGTTTILGENSKYIYILNSGFNMATTNAIRIVAYDRTDLKMISGHNLTSFPENNLNPDVSGIPAKARMLNSDVFEDKVILFWEYNGIIYAQQFNDQLTPSGKATVVLDISKESDGNTEASENELIWNTTSASVFVIRNDSTDTYAAGGEILSDVGTNVKVYYSVFDNDLNVLNKGKVNMPFISKAKLTSGTSIYVLGNDNDLYFLTPLHFGNEERIVDIIPYMYGKIDTEDDEVKTFVFESDQYILCNHKLVSIDNQVAIVGLYHDQEKDTDLKTRHGIYYVPVSELQEGDILAPVFTEFDKEQLLVRFFAAEKGSMQQKPVWDEMQKPFLYILDYNVVDNKTILFTLSNKPAMMDNQDLLVEDKRKNTYFAKYNISGNIEWIAPNKVGKYQVFGYGVSKTHILGNSAIFMFTPYSDRLVQCNLKTGKISGIASTNKKGLSYLFYENDMFAVVRTRKVKKGFVYSLPLTLFFLPWPVIIYTSEFSRNELFQFGTVKLKTDTE